MVPFRSCKGDEDEPAAAAKGWPSVCSRFKSVEYAPFVGLLGVYLLPPVDSWRAGFFGWAVG